MRYTRVFFSALLDIKANILSLWLVAILAFIMGLIIFYFTCYLMNPWLPIGLFIIYVLFKRDGASELIWEDIKQEWGIN